MKMCLLDLLCVAILGGCSTAWKICGALGTESGPIICRSGVSQAVVLLVSHMIPVLGIHGTAISRQQNETGRARGFI